MSDNAPWRLRFFLPATLVLLAEPGRHHPCLHGCLVDVARGGLVAIDGRTREQVLEQAARFLRLLTRRRALPPTAIAARMCSPWGGEDSWQIVVGAEIAFAPSRIEPYLPAA